MSSVGPPSATAHSGAPSRAGIYLLAVGQTICWAGLYYSFAALLLSWEQSLGWAKTDLTLGLMLAVLVSALMAPLSGRVIDAGGGRWLLTCGALGGAAALMLLSTATSQTSFILAWALIGVMQGACLYEACFGYMTRALGPAAPSAILRLTLVAGFASPVSFFAGAFLADMYGWRVAVMVFAGMVALVGAPLHYVGSQLLERNPGSPSFDADAGVHGATAVNDAVRRAIRKPAFWLMALAFPVMALNHGILLNHIIPLLVERGLEKTTAITAASVIGPMQVAGRLMVVSFENRTAMLTITLVSCAGMILAAGLLLAAGVDTLMVFTFAATQGAAYGLVSVLRPTVIAEALGRDGFGTIAGWLAVPYLAAYAFAPYAGALLWEAGGYDLAIAAALACAAFGLIAIAALKTLRAREVAAL